MLILSVELKERLLLLVPVCLLSTFLQHSAPAKPGSKVQVSADLSGFVAVTYPMNSFTRYSRGQIFSMFPGEAP